MSEPTDEQILQVITTKGDWEEGFRLLLQKYQERLYWQIRRIVREHEDAHDVMQNTMVKVFHNISRFEGKSQLYTWLYRIATNEAISFKNKQSRLNSTSIDDMGATVGDKLEAEPHLDGRAAERILEEAIRTLPEKQKEVFQLRYFEEMNYRDMSELLGTSEGALKASFHHAVKKIEQHISERST